MSKPTRPSMVTIRRIVAEGGPLTPSEGRFLLERLQQLEQRLALAEGRTTVKRLADMHGERLDARKARTYGGS